MRLVEQPNGFVEAHIYEHLYEIRGVMGVYRDTADGSIWIAKPGRCWKVVDEDAQ